VTASGEAWFSYNCKALIVKARELKKCMTALPIILDTKQYTEYLANRTGPTNLINDAKLLLTRETNLTFFDAVKNEHFLRNGSRTELCPEVYDKFAPFLRKQAKLTWKRTRSMDNWTGSLAHNGAIVSANPESGAYQECGSVDSDIVTYVNRYEIDDNNKVKTVRKA
jgi:hypothetical protein